MKNIINFFLQDSMDLFLGNYVVEENEGVIRPSPLQSERDWKFYAVRFLYIFYIYTPATNLRRH
jgi:hypothetical protein